MHIDEIIWPSVGASAKRRGACISTSRTPPIMQFNDQSRYCHPERSEGSLCPSRETFRSAQDDKTFPILLVKNHYRPPNRHQPKKSPSNSVGARVVEWGRVGLDGRPRPVPCAHLWRNALTPPPPGDHQGPPHIHPTALAPTDHPTSCLASRLSLRPITADLSAPPCPIDYPGYKRTIHYLPT